MATKNDRSWINWCRESFSWVFCLPVYHLTAVCLFLFLSACFVFVGWGHLMVGSHMTIIPSSDFPLKTKGRMMGVSPGVQDSSPPIRRPLLSKCKIVKPRSGRVNDCSRICLLPLDPVPSWFEKELKNCQTLQTNRLWMAPPKHCKRGMPFFLCIKAEGVWSVWSSRSILVLLTWLSSHIKFTMHPWRNQI